MPIYKVSMKCQLENVTNIRAPTEDFDYNIKVKCMDCQEVTEKWQVVSSSETVALPGSRGDAHFVIKCKLCNKTSSLNVLTKTQKPYNEEDVPKFKEIVSFEARGLAVEQFRFGEGWSCDSTESSKKFEDINLDEEFCDYDDLGNCPVGISEIEHKIH